MAPTIRADLVGSVHVTDRSGARVVLTAGDPVPDGFTVGDHLLEDAAPAEPDSTAPAAAKRPARKRPGA